MDWKASFYLSIFLLNFCLYPRNARSNDLAQAEAFVKKAEQHQADREYAQAIEALEQALPIYIHADEKQGMAKVYHALGSSYAYSRKTQVADSMYSLSLTIALDNEIEEYILLAAEGLTTISNFQGKFQRVLDLYPYLIKYSEGKKTENDLADFISSAGYAHFKLGDFDTAQVLFEQALAMKLAQEDPQNLPYTYNHLFALHNAKFEYGIATKYALAAIAVQEEKQDSTGMVVMLNHLSKMLIDQGNYEKAEPYLDRALSIARKRELKFYLGSALRFKGEQFLGQGRADKALPYFEEARSLFQGAEQYQYIAMMEQALVRAYIALKQYSQALASLDRIASYQDKAELSNYIHANSYYRAKIYFETGALSKAETFAKRTLDRGENGAQGISIQHIHALLAKIYEQKGDFAQALIHFEAYQARKDSLFTLSKSRAVHELEGLYEKEKKEKEIALLTQTNADFDTALEENRQQRIALTFGGTGLALLVGVLLYFFWLRNKRANILSEKNEVISRALSEKELLLKEIHHRVKNNLQIISSLLRLQARSISNEKAANAIRDGQNRVKSMALIHQNLYQGDKFTGVAATEYIEKLTQSLFHSYNIEEEKITLVKDIEPLRLDVDTIIPIGLIINELIINSLKHAFAPGERGSIHVSLKELDGSLFLEVRDTGKGFPENFDIAKSKSFGFRLIQSFSVKLKAEMGIRSESGSAVSMRIKHYKLAA